MPYNSTLFDLHGISANEELTHSNSKNKHELEKNSLLDSQISLTPIDSTGFRNYQLETNESSATASTQIQDAQQKTDQNFDAITTILPL